MRNSEENVAVAVLVFFLVDGVLLFVFFSFFSFCLPLRVHLLSASTYIYAPCAFSGSDGMDVVLQTSTVRGGEGGILINGSGPSGEAGGGNISAAGGVGYGAGGGAGGAVYLNSGPLIYSGGRGADGMVYVEMVDSGAFHDFLPLQLNYQIQICLSVLASSENI